MLRLLGVLCVMTAGVGFAVSVIGEMKCHLQRLYEMKQLLLHISSAAAFAQLPMEFILKQKTLTEDEVLQTICAQMAECLAQKEAYSGSEIWNRVFWEHRKELQINDMEMEIIANAGNAFFGKHAAENERILAVYLDRLDFVIDTERAQQKEKQKVAATLSVMGGLMLVILLI